MVYRYILVIYIITSWLPSVRESAVGEFLGKLSEPYLRPFRRIIPPLGGVLDISPIIALIALHYATVGLITVIELIGAAGK
ncbi:YggT family protein [Cohnella pontilimi]|uniref:YggT family protein n=2 Tax=Cohnella pontilimi TaxID=2564100 RepID=A0A4U0FF60_9BACL|nr:YggT family protein [Cohnella pontilimi]